MTLETRVNIVDISKDSDYVSIFGILNDGELSELPDFYQYRTANAKDSPISYKLDTKLSSIEKDTLLKRLLQVDGVEETKFLFATILRNKIKEIQQLALSDNTLKCDYIKGFFHTTNMQHKLDSLFKHIRDSFAHGRIATCGIFLILEDKKSELTGRLIISIDVLKIWMKVVNDFLNEKES